MKIKFPKSTSIFISGFVFGAFSMNHRIKEKLEKARPILVKIVGDAIMKCMDENLHGEELSKYLDEQMAFYRIVMEA